MSIPLTPADIDCGIYTDVARYLGRHWTSGKRLSLSRSQDTLAVCLGYVDYHDAYKSAKSGSVSEGSDLQSARLSICERLVSEYGLSKDSAKTLAEKLPLSKLSFTKVGHMVQNPVTEHKSWKFLLRALKNTSAGSWISSIHPGAAMMIMQPAVAVARAITAWAPDLLDKQCLRIHLVGASEIEASDSGRVFHLIPELLGRPSMLIEAVLVGPEMAQINLAKSKSYPAQPMPMAKMTLGSYMYHDSYCKPDITIFANPGLSDEYDSWLIEDDGLLEYIARNRAIFLGYMFDDCELDGEILRAHGVTSGTTDINPFVVTRVVEGHELQYSYGMASYLAEPGVNPLPAHEQEAILKRAAWVASIPAEGGGAKEFSEHFAKIQSIGDLQRIFLVDGSKLDVVNLSRGYLADLDTGEVFHQANKNQMPERLPFVLNSGRRCEYPGMDAMWIRRATWVAGVWIDHIEPFESTHPYFSMRGPLGSPDAASVLLHAFASSVGMDTASSAFMAMQKTLAPPPPSIIRPEHKDLFRTLNSGDFDAAYELLEDDPTLAGATDQDGKTVLFYACVEGDVDLALLFLDYGGDIDHLDREGWTALMEAARRNHADICLVLADHGADMEICTPLGWRALLMALARGAKASALALVESGADFDVVSPLGLSASDVAKQQGFEKEFDDVINACRDESDT